MANFLQGETTVPVVGKTKKWVVYGIGGLAAAYVAWKWYEAGTTDDEETTDDLVYDPDLSEYGQSTAGGSLVVGGNTGSTETDGTTPDAIDDNAEWTNRAVELLSQAGYDPMVVYAALGEFLARRALDKSEAAIARAAIAAVGEPPVGRPWTVIEESSTGTGTLPAPTGLKISGTTSSSVRLSWSPVAGAGSYQVYRNGSTAVKVSSTSAEVTGLTASTSYKFSVAAISTTGKTGSRSGEVTGKTQAKPSTPRPTTPSKPKYRTMRIYKRNQSLSDLVAEYNKKYRTRHTWQEIWNFNLKYRPASTVSTMRARGPDKVYIGTSFWFPL